MSDLSQGCTGECPCPPPPQLRLYQTIIFATPVLFAFMLLLMFCLLYFRRRGRSGASIESHMRAQLFVESLLANPPLEQGLSRSFRQRLPITLFDDEFTSTCQDLQCAVCLGDYQPQEKLQQLPICNHSFHMQCIDEWLSKNVTCPMCRTLLNETIDGEVVDQTLSSDPQTPELSLREREYETRMWEDRVVGEVQVQGALPSKLGTSNGESSHCVALCEQSTRLASEHIVSIERS